jgi:hypothetical protein
MIHLLESVIRETMQRISYQFSTYAPGLLAGMLIVLLAYVLARLARWLISRIFKGIAFDRFLRQSGLLSMIHPSGRVRTVEIVAKAAFWLILLAGTVTGVSALNTQLTSQIASTVLLLSPKLLAAAAIVIAGFWLGQFFSRHILVWAVNEGIPSGRRLAQAVRIVVVFVAVAAAADHLNFARNVFLAAFILVVGGIVLSASLALGLYGKEVLHRCLREKPDLTQEKEEMSIWRHI